MYLPSNYIHISVICTIIFKFYAFTVNLFGFASFFGVTLLSLDGFIAVCLFLRYQEFVTHKRVVALMISKWVCSAVLSFLRLWIPTRIAFIIYAIIFLSLLLTTAPLNFKIVVAVRRHANQIQALQVQPTAQNSGANMRDAAAWRKFAVGTLLVYLAFLVCYLPNFCFLIVYLISDPLSSNTVVLDLFSSTVLFLNSTLNPLIYCWKMRLIRLTILTICYKADTELTQRKIIQNFENLNTHFLFHVKVYKLTVLAVWKTTKQLIFINTT